MPFLVWVDKDFRLYMTHINKEALLLQINWGSARDVETLTLTLTMGTLRFNDMLKW